MTATADPTSTEQPDPTGAADWYHAYAAQALPEPSAITLTNAAGEPVTYYRRGETPPPTERPAMCWPRLARW